MLLLPLPLEALIKHNQHFINCLKLAIKQSKQPGQVVDVFVTVATISGV